MLCLSIVIRPCWAEGLCKENENVIFSFATKARKNLSVCKDTKNDYLVYRYGNAETIEMRYPDVLDANSWNAFTFSGMKRAGGKANAGFGDYDLSFSKGGFDYVVFQTWNDEDGTYAIGVVVRNEKTERKTRIDGLRDTQKGSLVLLDDERNHIENTAM